MKTELSLPNNAEAARLAPGHVRELAALAGLPPEHGEALALATEEACANILKHAFEPGEEGGYSIASEITPAALVLSFRDQGVPLDASVESALEDPEAGGAGHGLSRIRHAVDEAHWVRHGKEGKELRLVRYRPQADVTDHLPQEALAPIHPEVTLAPPQEYTVRRFQPEDAVGIARVVYRVYGYTYQHEELYYPERTVRLNEEGKLVSVVAVDAAGEVVGHYALERPEAGRVAESGEAVVSPAHRGRKLMERMREQIEAEAGRLGLLGIYGNAVTTHVYSQRADETFGCHACGATLGLLPRSVTFKGIRSEPLAQRVSCILYYEPMQPPPPAAVHAPPHHRPIMERIYAGFEAPVQFLEPDHARLPRHGRIAVQFRPAYSSGIIRVREIGADTAAEVRRARRDLCDASGAEAVYLELPLAQPGAPALCHAAEGDGFFFSGIGPQFAPDGDALRLQFLTGPLDPSLLQVYSPFARELVEYACRQRGRAKGEE